MYAKPLEVWDQLDQNEDRSENLRNVSQGEKRELQEKYLIADSFTVSNTDQDVIIRDDNGNIVSTSDYVVNLRDGSIEWNGADGEDLRVRYKTAPVPNEVTENKIKAATDRVDERTNTTFNGTKTVTETYDIESEDMRELVLFNRPVKSLEEVKFNKAKTGASDDFETLSLGRDGDVFLRDELSIEFATTTYVRKGAANLQVKYTYGYSDIPEQINKIVRVMAAQSLMEDTVLGEIIEGRDDYGTQLPEGFISRKEEILDSWTIQRMNEQVPVQL